MGFHLILVLVLLAAAVQIARRSIRSVDGIGETVLVWVLVGYCGVPMIGFMIFGLVHPNELAEMTGFAPGSPFQTFAAWALLGMASAATLALRFRGSYLMGPALAWAVFFLGATAIHLRQYASAGALSHGMLAMILATHGLVSVILLSALWASGVWRKEGVSSSA